MKNNGLFKYVVQITCILVLSYAAQIYSLNIDIKQLFGTWQCLNNDKKYLSPLNGAICAETGWIENMYRFGEVDTEVVIKEGRQVFKQRDDSQRQIKQNATSELVFLLFNAFPNIDGIHVSKSPASPAGALTPALIGQLLNELEKLIGSTCLILFDLSNDDEFKGIISDAKKALRKSQENRDLLSQLTKLHSYLKTLKKENKDPSEIKNLGLEIAKINKQLDGQLDYYSMQRIKDKYELLAKHMNNFYDICDKKIKLVLGSPDANKAAKKIQQLLQNTEIPDSANFLQLILKSLLECGLLKLQTLDLTLSKGPMYIGNNKYNIIVSEKDLPKNKLPALQELQYLPYTTHNILLSLLAMKLNTQDDLKAYFDSFKPSIMKDKWQEQCDPQIENDIKQFEIIRTSTNYEKALEDACTGKNLQDCYELIACTELCMLNPQQAPKGFIYRTSTIKIDGKTYSFSDCTETALLNFFCLVLTKLGLYDWKTKSFLLNDNERVKKAIFWLMTQELQVKKIEQKPTQEEIDQRTKNFLPDGFFDFFAKGLWKDPVESQNIWAQLISNKSDKGFEYVNNNIYELETNPKNFVTAFKYLCGSPCDTFDQICSVLEIYDSENKNTFSLGDFEKTKKYVGTAIWRISKNFEPSIDITFTLGFRSSHTVFAIARNKTDATPFIESIFKRSKTNLIIMLLTHLYAQRNIGIDKRLELIDFPAKPNEQKLAIFRHMLYGYNFVNTIYKSMNLIKWLYSTKEKLSNKEILTAKLNQFKDSDGNTLLNYAIAGQIGEIAKLLIEQGANINQKNDYGNTPLHLATSSGKTDIVEFLIKKGANINEKTSGGDTPLHIAIFQKQPELVKILIKHLINIKANLNIQNQKDNTPLHIAIILKQPEIAKILIEQLINTKANLNIQNKNGSTPLHVAIINNQPEIATILIKHLINTRANLNIQNEKGNTTLHIAIINNQPEIATILIDQLKNDKTALNKTNTDFNSPLHLAILNNQPKVAKVLINHDTHLNTRNANLNTPLHLAIALIQPETAKILINQLIKNKANLNKQNAELNTPLHLTILTSQPKIAKLLINQLIKTNANLNIQNSDGNTPLYLAIVLRQQEIEKILIDQLIKNKANFNIQNKNDNTPLHIAIIMSQPEIARILIEQLIKDKADLNIQNKNNETPLDLARKKGYDDIVKILEQGIKQTK